MSDIIQEQMSFEFETRTPIKGYPELHWTGKRPYKSTVYYPAQLKESYGQPKDDWMNKIFWGDNLQVMSHLLKDYRGQIDLIYIDPPFDSKADYKKKIELKGKTISNDESTFEEKQYGDIWTNDEYLQFMYERLILCRELLSDTGSIFLHCDWHKAHYLRILMDAVFGAANFRNEIIWHYKRWTASSKAFQSMHDNIFFYCKSNNYTFNKIEIEEEDYLKERKANRGWNSNTVMSGGRRIRQLIVYNKELFEQAVTAGRIKLDEWDKVVYSLGKKVPDDVWNMPFINPVSNERLDYPTQKPETILERIISVCTNPGDIVFDCFMGSGTTQAVAMKLGRRFIGADINLGAIQTTTKRLLNVASELNSQIDGGDKYTGFEVYNVNNYDLFRNPVEARDLILQAMEVQPFESSNVYDGEKDGRMVKIMPVNRIATKADLQGLLANLPYKQFEKIKEENPSATVLKLTIVCMGHEPDLAGALRESLSNYKVDIEVVDILHDRADLQFKRDAEADIAIEDGKLVIKNFFPLNLMQKLSLDKETVEEWRQLVESVMIDFNYDGAVLQPTVQDIPEKNGLVKGVYPIPEDAGIIRVKITDVLSESLEVEVKNG